MGNPRRSMCATMLALQCIVLGLATPVLITIADVDTAASLSIGLGLAALSLVVAGLLRYEWAYFAGFAVQAATLALGFVVPVMFALGAVFGALYTAAYLLGRKIEADRAAWAAEHQDPTSGTS
jgi:hypothetical protein